MKNLEDFDIPKVEIKEDLVELKLEEIKQKINEIKDFAYNDKGKEESIPSLGFPTKFDQNEIDIEREVSKLPKIHPKVDAWLNGLELLEESKLEVKTSSPYKKAILEDPTRPRTLRSEHLNKPNWKGSARHLVKGPTKEELFNKLDEEGRSIAAEVEISDKDSDLEEAEIQPSNEILRSAAVDPEDLSIQENKSSSKLILTNEIPSGVLLTEKNYSYEGEQHSNVKKGNNLLTSPEQIEYLNFEDFEKSEPKELFQEKIQVENTRNTKKKSSKNKKTKNKNIVKKQDFSPPMLDFSPLELDTPLSPAPEKKLEKAQSRPKVHKSLTSKALPNKYGGNHPEFGYDDLQFEVSELVSPTPPILPSIEISRKINNVSTKNTAKNGLGINPRLRKKSQKKREPEGYSELVDLSEIDTENKSDIQIVQESPFLQISHKNMPKRSKAKLSKVSISKNLNTSSPLKSQRVAQKLGFPSSKNILHKGKPDHSTYKPDQLETNEELGECSSEIFESCISNSSVETTSLVNIGDLIDITQKENKVQRINIPISFLPKRKNK